MRALEITVRGRVQGVFFRASTKDKALELGVKGWCKNQRDGSVFIHAEANDKALSEFEIWCCKGPMMASVTALESKEVLSEGCSSFEIRH
ncbi:MAG: acylphosphatase [Roseivirga sp.]|nr:acylphosphatase [Roseivirga sp.]